MKTRLVTILVFALFCAAAARRAGSANTPVLPPKGNGDQAAIDQLREDAEKLRDQADRLQEIAGGLEESSKDLEGDADDLEEDAHDLEECAGDLLRQAKRIQRSTRISQDKQGEQDEPPSMHAYSKSEEELLHKMRAIADELLNKVKTIGVTVRRTGEISDEKIDVSDMLSDKARELEGKALELEEVADLLESGRDDDSFGQYFPVFKAVGGDCLIRARKGCSVRTVGDDIGLTVLADTMVDSLVCNLRSVSGDISVDMVRGATTFDSTVCIINITTRRGDVAIRVPPRFTARLEYTSRSGKKKVAKAFSDLQASRNVIRCSTVSGNLTIKGLE